MSVERIAVLGAGIMGRGIAYAAAISGYETKLYDAVHGASASRDGASINW